MKIAGKISVTWFGPTPRVIVNDPKLVREILGNKLGHFQKRRNNGIVRRLANGLVSHEGQKWAAHRRIINPAFHVEKLKVGSMLIPDCCRADQFRQRFMPFFAGYSAENAACFCRVLQRADNKMGRVLGVRRDEGDRCLAGVPESHRRRDLAIGLRQQLQRGEEDFPVTVRTSSEHSEVDQQSLPSRFRVRESII